MWPSIRKDLVEEYSTPRSRRGNFNQYDATSPADLGAQSLQDGSTTSTADATTTLNTPANQPSVSLTKTLETPIADSATSGSRADIDTPLDLEGNLATEPPTPALEKQPSSLRSSSRGEPKSTAGTTNAATPAAPGSQITSQQSAKSESTTGGSTKAGGSLKPSGNIIPIIPLDSSQSSKTAPPAPSNPNLIDLSKYDNLEVEDIGLDVRPRIRNIIEELYSEHDWSWPPAPAKDVRKVSSYIAFVLILHHILSPICFPQMRFFKRKKNKIFYNQQFYDFSTFLSIVSGTNFKSKRRKIPKMLFAFVSGDRTAGASGCHHFRFKPKDLCTCHARMRGNCHACHLRLCHPRTVPFLRRNFGPRSPRFQTI